MPAHGRPWSENKQKHKRQNQIHIDKSWPVQDQGKGLE